MDITSQINVDQATDPEIESVPTNSVNVAHITEPTTAPVVDEYNDDFPPVDKTAITDISRPVIYYSDPPANLYLTESRGFFTAKKYQSSYLI